MPPLSFSFIDSPVAGARENWTLLTLIIGGAFILMERDGVNSGDFLAKSNSLTSDRGILHSSRRFMVMRLHV